MKRAATHLLQIRIDASVWALCNRRVGEGSIVQSKPTCKVCIQVEQKLLKKALKKAKAQRPPES